MPPLHFINIGMRLDDAVEVDIGAFSYIARVEIRA